ncbi:MULTISPECIES: 4-oxalomesaconate tautomerase [unclassified Streptomyces]|uniref:4-oxalomesaconate tautomerase n=1 Tax=unclassified Streptomyces TaxID=2593676 RepID=UPI000F6ED4BA|nr:MULTISPECIES: 4-oxalomesaconate tautomerase [unclassified Streptomyces]AZM59452.1 4-oxalomesaconate tautomerase [Streptomyces sp. WAC 01438]RSM95693.1 4-oxalomesaconate tautomerase [Streptomyces sp. WAC 01420]
MTASEAGVRCLLMRGGTSKGAYFLAEDLPREKAERDDLLLRIMGSPDPRQIDGIGGAHPLTSKVAVVSRSADPAADLDYLFLQLGVEEGTVSERQNCGNLLAGVGPFGVERGLIAAGAPFTDVRIRMLNMGGGIATARFPTVDGGVQYAGTTAISGVPGTAAPIVLNFTGTAGSVTGQLLPTGKARDVIDGVEVTCVDNGVPVVVAAAEDLGITGYEPAEELARDHRLRDRVQSLRLQAGTMMGLGDVSGTSVPKTTLVAAPRDGGTLCTRTFIPLRPHTSIGVLGAVGALTAALVDDGVARRFAVLPPDGHPLDVEHPTGHTQVELEIDTATDPPTVRRAGNVRTARKLFDGTVFPRHSARPGPGRRTP